MVRGSSPGIRTATRTDIDTDSTASGTGTGTGTCTGGGTGRARPAQPGTMAEDLVLETWDLHCDRNGREHRTADMGCKQLVLRRGQPFTITLRFSGRGYEEGVDKLSFNVETGPCPSETSGTSSHFAMTDCPEESCWSAVVQQQDGESLAVSLCSPPNACIGRYSLTLETCTDYQGSSYQIGDFILLFNPWHPGEAFTSLSPGIPGLRQAQDAPPAPPPQVSSQRRSQALV